MVSPPARATRRGNGEFTHRSLDLPVCLTSASCSARRVEPEWSGARKTPSAPRQSTFCSRDAGGLRAWHRTTPLGLVTSVSQPPSFRAGDAGKRVYSHHSGDAHDVATLQLANAPTKAAAGVAAVLSLHYRWAFLPRMPPLPSCARLPLCSLRITARVPSRGAPHRCGLLGQA